MPVLKSKRRPGPRSLKSMALTVALRHASQITDLGDMAFVDAAPILRHIHDPDQLHMLETNSSCLADNPKHMAAVWSRLLSKKMPGWDAGDWLATHGLSADDRARMSWYDLFQAVKHARDSAVAADTAKLLQDMQGHRQAKESKSTHIVSSSRALNRITPGISAVKRRGPGGGPGMPSTLSFGGGSRTKTTTSQNVMKRVRREAKESLKVAQLSRVNAHSLVQSHAAAVAARNQIRHAPAAMLHDHRVAHKKDVLTAGAIRAPRRSGPGSLGSHGSHGGHGGHGIPGTGLGVGNAAHEARLLALKGGAARPGAARQQRDRSPVRQQSSAKRQLDDDSEPWDDLFGGDTHGDDDDADRQARAKTAASSKRARLTVDDLESGYDDERPPSLRRAPAMSSSRPSASYSASSSSTSRMPAKPLPVREPAPPPAYVPRASPSKGAPTAGRKKVDIFMRPKKR